MMQSLLKKRKVGGANSPQPPQYSVTGNQSRSPTRSKRVASRRGNVNDSSISSTFQAQMCLNLRDSVQKANEWLCEAIESKKVPMSVEEYKIQGNGRISFAYAEVMAEYKRLVQCCLRRYGSSITGTALGYGEVIGMGNDDANQIGTQFGLKSDDEEKETHTKPSYIRQLRAPIRAISAGGMHSVALSVDGEPYSWGSSDEGTLGRIGGKEYQPAVVSGFTTVHGENEDNTIIQVVAGDSHSLFLSITGNVYQCGQYKDCDSGKFSDIKGDNGTCLGYNETPVHVHQIKGKVKEIFTRANFNVALLEDDSLVTWGFGNKGELARSAEMTQLNDKGHYILTKEFFYDLETGKVNEDIVKEHFLTPKPPRWGGGGLPYPKKTVISVATGAYHLLVAARDPGQLESMLYVSGINNYGQLGLGSFGSDEDETRHELTLVDSLKNRNIAKVAAGQHFSLALNLTGDELYAFGRADYGQLGLGKFELGENVCTPTLVRFPAIQGTQPPQSPVISNIVAGDLHSMAITIDNEVYTWGFNEVAVTGHEDTENDIHYPTLLDLKNMDTKDKTTTQVFEMSGGGQHTLMLVKRFRGC